MALTEEKIIITTIECIEKYGIEKTTIRQIGKMGGFNSASISYYFRSKDALISRVMEIALGNAFDLDNFSESVGLPIKQRLTSILDGMIAGALKFPNLTKAYFSELFHNKDSTIVERCNAFLVKIEHELTTAYPDKPTVELRVAVMQASSATFLFLGLFPEFFTAYKEINLADETIRYNYAKSVVNNLF